MLSIRNKLLEEGRKPLMKYSPIMLVQQTFLPVYLSAEIFGWEKMSKRGISWNNFCSHAIYSEKSDSFSYY